MLVLPRHIICLMGLSLLYASCGSGDEELSLFEVLPAQRTGVGFVNRLLEGDSLNILNYVYYYNGGGVGIADFNNDGREDLFFTGNETSCRLYLNKGAMQFEDITEQAGLWTEAWATGVAIADVNADGFDDIYICVGGHPEPSKRANRLYLNEGPGPGGQVHFREAAAEYGIADTSYSTHAAFFDYDLDGDLDLYVLNHANQRSTLNTPLPRKLHGEGASTDRLYRNNGGFSEAEGAVQNRFTDVSGPAGIQAEGYSLGIAVSDINRDGWPDIYVANDFIYDDLFYINQQDGTFQNRAGSYLRHQSYNAMGCDIADFNNDAWQDIFVPDMLPEDRRRKKTMAGAMNYDKWNLMLANGFAPQYMRNTLQLNNGPAPRPGAFGQPSFSEVGQFAGIHQTDWSWSGLFADLDDDGWKDLFVTNGYLRDITDKDFIDYSAHLGMFQSQEKADQNVMEQIRKQQGIHLPNYCFRNEGNLSFAPCRSLPPSFSNGAAYGDLDGDGDLDLAINNINEPAFLLENKAGGKAGAHFLNIALAGPVGNPRGIGARLWLFVKGQQQYLEQYPYRGFQSSVSTTLHFGLGKQALADSLIIEWPGGRRQALVAVPAGQVLRLKYEDAEEGTALPFSVSAGPLLRDVSGQNGLEFTHRESPHNDFLRELLLPHGFSRSGPGLAVGDLDRDGLEDVFIGGAKGQPGRVFYQKADGSFKYEDVVEGAESEDIAAIIFDANNDGANDLYVVSGGSEFPAGDSAYQDRLYINNGKGGLHLAPDALPAMHTSGSCVVAADLEGDGRLDLFVGGRVELGQYPLPPRSYLLRNEGGVFSDVTAERAPGLERIGMVTDAVWASLGDRDGPGLVLVGEWMPVVVFRNENGHLARQYDSGLENSKGWWYSLAGGDFDQDGDIDFLAGNLGLNTPYRVSASEPARIYANDFDTNGSLDAVMSYYIQGIESPAHSRDILFSQIPGLEKKYPRYGLYAEATLQQLFEKEKLDAAYFLECNTTESSYLENIGNGRFTRRPLPPATQFAPVSGLICADFDQDGCLDALLAGNDQSPQVNTGYYDASPGQLLLGDGRGGFALTGPMQSGFWTEGEVKDIELARKGNTGLYWVLAAMNNDTLRTFEGGRYKPLSPKKNNTSI
ncbi:MAG: VCBS repeat-containing protein [Phaeodactylibacter sp.]|nr:VCBS repeat-containing protein [Phaeodactylibacter sp.]